MRRNTTNTLLLAAALLTATALLGCGGDSNESTDSTDSTDATGTTDGTDPTDATDSTDATDNTGNTDTTDATDSTDATDGTENTDNTDATDSTDGPTCPEQIADRPGALSEHMGVWDPVKERFVFFGGNPEFPVQCIGKNSFLADTWAYWPACDQWEKLPEGPSARGRGAAVYDADHHAMIVFGGRFRAKGEPGTNPYQLFDDVWWLDLTTDTWSQVQATNAGPSGRVNAAAIYDPKGQRVVIFGGNTSTSGASFIPKNDTWALDTNTDTWTKLETGAGPTAREFTAGIYDPVRHQMVVTQGGDANAFLGPFLGDTWALDLDTDTWSKLNEGGLGTPPRRIWPGAFYAPSIDRMVMFAGHDDQILGNRNDVWTMELTNGIWQLLTENDTLNKPGNGFCDFPADFAHIVEGTPERRFAHLVVYDEAADSMYVYGGKSDCGLLDDMWALSLSDWSWTDLVPATVGEACLRYSDTCTSHCN